MGCCCCCKFGGVRRTCGVEFDDRSTEIEGDGEEDIVAIGGGEGRRVV